MVNEWVQHCSTCSLTCRLHSGWEGRRKCFAGPISYRVHAMHQLPSIVRDPKWDSAKTGTIKIATDSGSVAMDGAFNVTTNWANITWVATDTSYSTLLVHVRNGYSSNNFASRHEGTVLDRFLHEGDQRTISKVRPCTGCAHIIVPCVICCNLMHYIVHAKAHRKRTES